MYGGEPTGISDCQQGCVEEAFKQAYKNIPGLGRIPIWGFSERTESFLGCPLRGKDGDANKDLLRDYLL